MKRNNYKRYTRKASKTKNYKEYALEMDKARDKMLKDIKNKVKIILR